jgi:hypothetical protein
MFSNSDRPTPYLENDMTIIGYLTASPVNYSVTLAALSNNGTDSNQHWRIAVTAEGSALASAPTSPSIAGYKLNENNGSMKLSNTEYALIGFLRNIVNNKQYLDLLRKKPHHFNEESRKGLIV